MLSFALNHRVAPDVGLPEFLDLAVQLGINAVELRNDLPGQAIADGTSPETVRGLAADRSITIMSINALYPFNVWNDDRANEAKRLIGYAKRCGAAGIVMCPLNDPAAQMTDPERLAAIRKALAALAPMLRDAGIRGLVEPLGFPESSLRRKREAIEMIDDVAGGDVFQLVHDTFHHHVAGENEVFPDRTGLIHVSGVEDRNIPREAMRDSHRVLVGPADRLDNVTQIRALGQGGYGGAISLEPFAESVARSSDLAGDVARSLAFMRAAVEAARQPT